ncbi:MAG: metallophosphoesterase family protein [Bacteroidota bacterium]
MKTLFLAGILMILAFGARTQDFYFVQISDTHLGYKNHDEISMKVAESVNNLPFDLRAVIVTGDVFQDNIHEPQARQSFREFRDAFHDPVKFLPGNHDLLPERYDEHQAFYQDYVGGLNHVFSVDSVVFLMYYSIPHADTSLPDYQQQKTWFEYSMEMYSHRPVIVCHHQPSVIDFYNNATHESWPESERVWWSDILNQYGVEAVICGHFHRNEFHWLDSVPVYVASSVAGFWGRQASYRIYHYQDGKLSFNTVYINE